MIFRQHMFKKGLPLMNRAMDAYALRQQTTAKNIANGSTPHYRPERVKFEELFHKQQVMISGVAPEGSSSKAIPIGRQVGDQTEIGEKAERAIPEPEIFFSGDTHVNIDKEMSEMAQNQIRFRFVSLRAKAYFQEMSNAITGQAR
ncbi:MAG: flagellar basal body rod protein FlgB [Candidatus Kapaibacteriales bacterium]